MPSLKRTRFGGKIRGCTSCVYTSKKYHSIDHTLEPGKLFKSKLIMNNTVEEGDRLPAPKGWNSHTTIKHFSRIIPTYSQRLESKITDRLVQGPKKHVGKHRVKGVKLVVNKVTRQDRLPLQFAVPHPSMSPGVATVQQRRGEGGLILFNRQMLSHVCFCPNMRSSDAESGDITWGNMSDLPPLEPQKASDNLSTHWQ